MAKVSAMQAQLEAAAGRNAPPKSREGRVHVGAWLPEAYSRNILLVRAQTGLSVKAIFAKALNDLFLSHNIPVIDEE
jgi:hypothetical protein